MKEVARYEVLVAKYEVLVARYEVLVAKYKVRDKRCEKSGRFFVT